MKQNPKPKSLNSSIDFSPILISDEYQRAVNRGMRPLLTVVVALIFLLIIAIVASKATQKADQNDILYGLKATGMSSLVTYRRASPAASRILRTHLADFDTIDFTQNIKESSKLTFFDTGPFWFCAKYQRIYRIEVQDHARNRVFYLRTGDLDAEFVEYH